MIGTSGTDAFESLMGSVDPPMWIVTARSADGEAVGCLVGFATQVSIDPPRFAVCISRANHTFEVATTTGHLAVHVLRRADREVAERFGSTTGDELPAGGGGKFAGLDVVDGPGGVPVISGLDWFGGRVWSHVDCGDHVAVLLDPHGGSVTRSGEGPLGLRSVAGIRAGHPA